MERELLLKASIQNPTDRQERIKPWTEDKDCCAQLAREDFSMKDLRRGLPTSTAATLSSDLAEVSRALFPRAVCKIKSSMPHGCFLHRSQVEGTHWGSVSSLLINLSNS